MKTLEKLEKVFSGKGEVRGYEFTQIRDCRGAYMYIKTHIDSNVQNYEVIRKIVVPKIIWETKEKTGHYKETYPRSNRFGVDAWNFADLESATIKMNQIKKESDNE